MDNKLYVGNLAYSVRENDLQELFAQAGTVKSVTLIMDRATGRSKGFAFVEMENQEEAQKAISLFNGKELQDRALTVNIARPREERPEGGRRDFRPGGGFGGGYGRGGGGGGNRNQGNNRNRR